MPQTLHSERLIELFSNLGFQLQKPAPELEGLIGRAPAYNPWFTQENVRMALHSIRTMLNPSALQDWLKVYETRLNDEKPVKTIGLIMAGNIPLVGFHDLLCVLASGHRALVKSSSQDPELIPYVIRQLTGLDSSFSEKVGFTERLSDFDAVIATGSNNSSRYFEYYFGKYPHIIRKNRNSVAVLSGKESAEEIELLGKDIFSYFGLGCRNVSKLYVPKGYDFNILFEGLTPYQNITDQFKYANNYDYNKTLLLLNRIPHFDNGFLLVSENASLSSPMASLYFEYYKDIGDLEEKLQARQDNIQCIASQIPLNTPAVPFGKTQEPELWDYADGIDTMEFLLSLS